MLVLGGPQLSSCSGWLYTIPSDTSSNSVGSFQKNTQRRLGVWRPNTCSKEPQFWQHRHIWHAIPLEVVCLLKAIQQSFAESMPEGIVSLDGSFFSGGLCPSCSLTLRFYRNIRYSPCDFQEDSGFQALLSEYV